MKKLVISSLTAEALADKAKALTSLELLTQHAVGVGEHSTNDFHDNAREALDLLVDANDRLETLEKFFPESFEQA